LIDTETLEDKLRQGDRRLLARAMSMFDAGGDEAQALEARLRQSTGQVPWWGFTGPPGVGKSTLIDALLVLLRQRDRRIGVVAVDPTSPISNGALLGDRVRMMRHAVDPEVFIRSLATHHCQGGLSDAALHCARLLEAAGYDPILIETVGVGQNDVDIASVADLCVVILGPGYGDDVQLIKAGLLEVADLVVVNKCDLPGANRLLHEVRAELGPEHARPGSAPEILGVEAKSGKGMDELLAKLFELDAAARRPEQRERHRRRRILGEIRRQAMRRYEKVLAGELAGAEANELVARLEKGEATLDAVVDKLIPIR
jgi:LAO/AO transport system kinase